MMSDQIQTGGTPNIYSTPQPPAPPAKPCVLAIVIGAATIMYAIVRDVLVLRQPTPVAKSVPLAITSSLPWLAAGIALFVRGRRGALCWARAIAAWIGGFFIGLVGLVIGVAFLAGPNDSTTWLLHTLGFVLFLVVGVLLLKVAFKRNA